MEIIGERWSLLIVRDAFYGVRRFSDFQTHLKIPKAVLSQRLTWLTEEGVFATTPSDGGGHDEYILTDKGLSLWPVIEALAQWGGSHYQTARQRRTFSHVECGGLLQDGFCARCGKKPTADDTITKPPRETIIERNDHVSTVLRRPHRLLQPIH